MLHIPLSMVWPMSFYIDNFPRVRKLPFDWCLCLCLCVCPFFQGLQNELRARQSQVGSLQGLWGQLQPAEEEGVGEGEESVEAREKLHVTANKLWTLLRQVAHDLSIVQERLVGDPTPSDLNLTFLKIASPFSFIEII